MPGPARVQMPVGVLGDGGRGQRADHHRPAEGGRVAGRICRSRDTAARTGRSERLADLAISSGATAYLCGTGGSRSLNPAPFAAQGLEVQFFTPPARLATLPPEAVAVSGYRLLRQQITAIGGFNLRAIFATVTGT